MRSNVRVTCSDSNRFAAQPYLVQVPQHDRGVADHHANLEPVATNVCQLVDELPQGRHFLEASEALLLGVLEYRYPFVPAGGFLRYFLWLGSAWGEIVFHEDSQEGCIKNERKWTE